MKVRIKFRKFGVMKFIGHLDIMRYFQKAMRRADIPIAFTAGYSPHMIMSFANPLGVGLTSDGEYFDIELKTTISSKLAVKRLNQTMVEGIEIISFLEIPDNHKTGMSIVAGADYLAIPVSSVFPFSDKDILEFLSQDTIAIVKKTKKSMREVDIRPLIYDMKLENENIFMKLATGSVDNLKPDLVIDALNQFAQVNKDDIIIQYHRKEVYAWDDEHTTLVTLESFGTVIPEIEKE